MRLIRSGFMVALIAGGSAQAQPANMTAGELALTPLICQDVQGIEVTGWVQHYRQSPRSAYWVGVMGNTFWAMHHYCWALIHLQRANRADVAPHVREHMIRTAIADYAYVLRHARPDFVLLPELYFRIGDAYVLLEEYAQAIDSFQKSRAAKGDYWPPYLGHALILERLKKRKEARDIIEQGLRVMPAQPSLVEAYVRLGGTYPSGGLSEEKLRAPGSPKPPVASVPQ